MAENYGIPPKSSGEIARQVAEKQLLVDAQKELVELELESLSIERQMLEAIKKSGKFRKEDSKRWLDDLKKREEGLSVEQKTLKSVKAKTSDFPDDMIQNSGQ